MTIKLRSVGSWCHPAWFLCISARPKPVGQSKLPAKRPHTNGCRTPWQSPFNPPFIIGRDYHPSSICPRYLFRCSPYILDSGLSLPIRSAPISVCSAYSVVLHLLFPQTKLTKDRIQQILCRRLAYHFANRVRSDSQFHRGNLKSLTTVEHVDRILRRFACAPQRVMMP